MASVKQRLCIAALVLSGLISSAASEVGYFAIAVVDAQTGRGVPLVELRTVNSIRYWTDSSGLVAFDEPGLMDQEVYFHVRSYGYDYPKDGFDNRGVKLKAKRGGKAEIKLKRLNIAERLYRITGSGIYRDSVLLGQRVPLKRSELNGQVMGQDTVIATKYRGKIYWFWGDTDKASYPLGNFGASGATSELPGQGGLDPSVGIDLTYFVDDNGFSKPMCPKLDPGLQWIESLFTLDDGPAEKLLARVASMGGLDKTHAWHLALFNDKKQVFESLVRWDIHDSHDVTNPFRARVGTNEYFYLYPNYRVKADLRSLTNLAAYEAFTCVASGAGEGGEATKIDRDAQGGPRYQWRAGAQRLKESRQRELIRNGSLKPSEAWRQLCDVETGQPNRADRGTVAWNAFRQRWVMIAGAQAGEVWFAEADTPVGPWVYSRRVASHDHYNFYNVSHHPLFDQEDGRLVYFEGTYTAAFSDAKEKTPRYDYNQIMYRLTLDDPRLALPAPVYAVRDPGGVGWMMRSQVAASNAWERIESLPFFAMPPERPAKGLIPIYAVTEDGATTLQAAGPAGGKGRAVFFALPAVAGPVEPKQPAEFNSSAVVPLYEYRRNGARFYSTEAKLANEEAERSHEPLCRVWKNPMSVLILDSEAVPVLAK
jgi:hypothetical protein